MKINMKILRIAVVVLVLTWSAWFMAGCAVGPDYVVPDQALPDGWHSPEPGGTSAAAADRDLAD